MSARPKKKNNPAKKPANPKSFKPEPEEKIDWKQLARDERTWKITGTVFILFAVFLFISFISYLFTWQADQDVAKKGFSALFDNSLTAQNLLGRLGALVSHFFINYGFGIASFLICTFFFVVGVNLLFRRRVFSIWRNLKYVTVGLVVMSVSMAFLFGKSGFPYGGAVGDMITAKLTGALGTVGTAAVLLLLAGGYFIWQFNPSFNWPKAKVVEFPGESETNDSSIPANGGITLNEAYAQADNQKPGNSMSTTDGIIINFPEEKPEAGLQLIEKEEPLELQIEKIEQQQPTFEKEIVSDLLHTHEDISPVKEEPEFIETIPPIKDKPPVSRNDKALELEIKSGPEKIEEETVPSKPPR